MSSWFARFHHFGSGLTAIPDPSDYLDANFIQRQNLIGETGVCHEAGHAPNNACRLVLGQNLPSKFVNAFATPQAILAHSRHLYRQNVIFVDVGHGSEQDVHCGSAGIFRRSLVSQERCMMVVTRSDHMVVTGSYPCAARLQDGAREALCDTYLRLRRKTFSQQPGKYRGHMLHYDDGNRKVARKDWHQNGESIRAPP